MSFASSMALEDTTQLDWAARQLFIATLTRLVPKVEAKSPPTKAVAARYWFEAWVKAERLKVITKHAMLTT